MSRKKTSAKVVLPGITPSNQGEMGAVLLGFASALMSNSSMEDAYEKAPATASGAAEESPVKKQRKTPANYFIFPGDRRITGQHAVQLRQAIRVFSAIADNWEISRHLQGLAALAQNQLKDADVKKSDASAVKRYLHIGIRDIRIAYPHAEGMPDVEYLMRAAQGPLDSDDEAIQEPGALEDPAAQAEQAEQELAAKRASLKAAAAKALAALTGALIERLGQDVYTKRVSMGYSPADMAKSLPGVGDIATLEQNRQAALSAISDFTELQRMAPLDSNDEAIQEPGALEDQAAQAEQAEQELAAKRASLKAAAAKALAALTGALIERLGQDVYTEREEMGYSPADMAKSLPGVGDIATLEQNRQTALSAFAAFTEQRR